MTKLLLNLLLGGGLLLIWFVIWSDYSELAVDGNQEMTGLQAPTSAQPVRTDSLEAINPFHVPHQIPEKQTLIPVKKMTVSREKPAFSAVLLGKTLSDGRERFIVALPDGRVFHVQPGDTVEALVVWKSVGDTLILRSHDRKTLYRIGFGS
ncbi:MAG: hypothetical protein L6Q77_13295 [Bacteroidetes bacterium]|nr:hypothetical protein [Bacteroidota bacterium]